MIILGSIITLIGAILIVAFFNSILKCRTAINAEICKLDVKKSYFRGTTVKEYTPVFSYTADNKTYTKKANLSTYKSKKYMVGQNITVYINKNNPDEVRYGSGVGFLITGLVITAVGLLFVILSLM